MENDAVMQTLDGPPDKIPEKALTIRDLYLMLKRQVQTHGDKEISLMCGPEWDEIPLQQVLMAAEHGTLFLIGSPVEDIDTIEQEAEEDAKIVEIIEATEKRTKPSQEPDFDHNLAEEA